MAQTADQVYNSLNASYDPLRVANDQQQAQVQQEATAQLSSLDQAKVNAFKDIDLSANRKGVLFSGFSPDQEATYLGTKYLPARANVSNNLVKTLNQLRADNANIGAKQRTVAEQTVNDQIKQEREDAYRQAQLDLGYARLSTSKSKAAASAANKTVSQSDIVGEIRAGLESVKGRDNHVAPQNLKKAYDLYAGAGYDPKTFWKYFQGYWNPNQGNYSQQFYGR